MCIRDRELLAHVGSKHSEIISKIESGGKLTDEITGMLDDVVKSFIKNKGF